MNKVRLRRGVLKTVESMPKVQQKLFADLLYDLQEKGAVLKEWQNFSKLSKNEYHCHLSRKWVACWKWEKGTIEIEVYYAGSRENAPY